MIKMLETFQTKGDGLWSDYRGFEQVKSVGERDSTNRSIKQTGEKPACLH